MPMSKDDFSLLGGMSGHLDYLLFVLTTEVWTKKLTYISTFGPGCSKSMQLYPVDKNVLQPLHLIRWIKLSAP